MRADQYFSRGRSSYYNLYYSLATNERTKYEGGLTRGNKIQDTQFASIVSNRRLFNDTNTPRVSSCAHASNGKTDARKQFI